MNQPSTAREALIVEAIGDVATLIDQVEAAKPVLNEACQAMQQASQSLRDELASFDKRMTAVAENAKTMTIKHIATRTDEAARQTISQQSRAMADAARVAFGAQIGAELGAAVQRMQTMLERHDQREKPWQRWLTHAATAATASAATFALTMLWPIR
jgi:cell division septum initiation protein DivIVA